MVSKSGTDGLTDLYRDQEESETRLVLRDHIIVSLSNVMIQIYWVCLCTIQVKGCLDPQQCPCTLEMALMKDLYQDLYLSQPSGQASFLEPAG